MNRDKLRQIFQTERPDLIEVPVEPAKADKLPADVQERAGAEATWAAKRARARGARPDRAAGLSSDEIRNKFAPRDLGADGGHVDSADSGAPGDEAPGIVRGVKRRGGERAPAADDGAQGPGVKDFIVDEKRGVIGSQG